MVSNVGSEAISAVSLVDSINNLVTVLSYPFLALFNAGAAFFRAGGNSKFPMKVSVISNLLNIGGNAVLIFALKHEGGGRCEVFHDYLYPYYVVPARGALYLFG